MNRRASVIVPLLMPLMLVMLLFPTEAAAAEPPLKLAQTIPLKGVEGRIDHLSIDTTSQRLFIAALGNGSVEMLDLRAGAQAGRIDKLAEPQGVCWMPDVQRLAVASGGDGTVRF